MPNHLNVNDPPQTCHIKIETERKRESLVGVGERLLGTIFVSYIIYKITDQLFLNDRNNSLAEITTMRPEYF